MTSTEAHRRLEELLAADEDLVVACRTAKTSLRFDQLIARRWALYDQATACAITHEPGLCAVCSHN